MQGIWTRAIVALFLLCTPRHRDTPTRGLLPCYGMNSVCALRALYKITQGVADDCKGFLNKGPSKHKIVVVRNNPLVSLAPFLDLFPIFYRVLTSISAGQCVS